ncbi:NADH-ubiquinone oxidoreductase 30.4 kDa subunit, mitochondrial precursor [Scheffersomyces stipitis CBS 6054]|uniref:NADH-ubiquinone oxidoreductase 30.4 kDa subunit, mitochondrial n=1 Tax=Scheffersomyces stipitis (strain ATCC 58785 / CBS 6054 / NBRC 10063 / NRRL Y-11545) TaxID=322104 RepID=A3M007_PICST|nr:NADH-ubiquinone oxidoreductase 30.4 kDa subunit, mitochondrial precursor [Scheffersomyces stipitis CBS 6054]ABN68435.2 NADH-ubiquinone oxidoreductase 30.4 kDa subunit, mitochondrial precursor [Scheffersomyces stipitis CBS 6054]
MISRATILKRVAQNSRSISSCTVRSFSASVSIKKDHELVNLNTLPRRKPSELNVPLVNPTEKYKEQIEELHKFGAYIMACMPKYIQQFSVWKDELTIYVAPSALRPTMVFLKNHTSAQFKSCVDVTAADYPSRTNRFDVVYNLLSVRHNSRIRVKTYANETSAVPSLVPIYQGVNWFERETYDLFGIFFEGHPDLRRIMTDYGFEGHPLRKDFPTTGYTEVRYDEEKKRVIYEPLELTQAWRNFSVGSSVWEQVGEGKDFTPETFKLPTPEPEPTQDEQKK